LPIGGVETSKFLRTVGEYAGLDKSVVEDVIQKKEDEFYHYLLRSVDLLTEFQINLPKKFYSIIDSNYALGIAKFLVNDMGFFPLGQYITEDVPEEHRETIEGYFKDLAPGISARVVFSQDGGVINEDILNSPREDNPLILGSSWEVDLAREIGGFLVSVGLPVIDRLILHKTFVGYRGGLNLVEDIYSKALSRQREY
jgi:nitrogenase molybdenum-iron protein beta chain